MQYAFRILLDLPALALAGVLTMIALLTRHITKPAVMIALPCTMHLLYVIWAGGDHMPAQRMFVLLIAPSALLIFMLIRSYSTQIRLIWMIFLVAATLREAAFRPPEKMDAAAFFGELVGRHIEQEWPRGITIALNTAGSTPYFATGDRIFIDMLGLNDPVIAKRENVPMLTEYQRWPGHSKGDGSYVLRRAPDRIIFSGAAGTTVEDAWFLSGYEMSLDPEFARCYEKRIDKVSYSEAFSIRGPKWKENPLEFIYYVRTCA
jgi:hypothetical protein